MKQKFKIEVKTIVSEVKTCSLQESLEVKISNPKVSTEKHMK